MNINDIRVSIAEVQRDVLFIKETVGRLEANMASMRETYVTKEEFDPVKSVAMGLVSFVVLSVLALALNHFLGIPK